MLRHIGMRPLLDHGALAGSRHALPSERIDRHAPAQQLPRLRQSAIHAASS